MEKAVTDRLCDVIIDFARDEVRWKEHVRIIRDALTDAASILDAAKAEWSLEGAWSEFDQRTREKITEALRASYAMLGETP